MSQGGFKGLLVWQKAQQLAVAVYRSTYEGPLSRDYGLRDQMRRAAVSISSNIAEGSERGSDKDGVRFFFIAKSSVAELRPQLDLAYKIGSIDDQLCITLDDQAMEVAKMLRGLINARQPNDHPSRL